MKPLKSTVAKSATKLQFLRQSGTINARALAVQDPLFLEQEFFDPQDLTQVKYEMLRRVQKDVLPISTAAARFGFSRPAFYKAQRDFTREGLVGLIPRRRGPKQGHKLTPAVLAFAQQVRGRDSSVRTLDLVRQIQKQFGVQVHRRTLERALVAAKKKQRTP